MGESRTLAATVREGPDGVQTWLRFGEHVATDVMPLSALDCFSSAGEDELEQGKRIRPRPPAPPTPSARGPGIRMAADWPLGAGKSATKAIDAMGRQISRRLFFPCGSDPTQRLSPPGNS